MNDSMMTGHESSRNEQTPDAEESRLNRQFRRSKRNRVIGGVCGGLGRYADIDPIVFRIAFLALLIPGGIGLIAYIIAWIAIPEFRNVEDEMRDDVAQPADRRIAGTIAGGLLIIAGMLILVERLVGWFDVRIIGGAALLLVGIVIIWHGMKRGE